MKKYSYKKYPDKNGNFGQYGGRYVAETLMPLILELEEKYLFYKKDKKFKTELDTLSRDYIGRPSPLYFAKNLTKLLGGAKIYFKRDELNHTGAHKINNCLGQILLAKRMNKKRIIAETGAGQHGVATATVCALFGLECVVYMGKKDIERHTDKSVTTGVQQSENFISHFFDISSSIFSINISLSFFSSSEILKLSDICPFLSACDCGCSSKLFNFCF